MVASRTVSSAQDCSDDIQGEQPLYLREYINDHLPARVFMSCAESISKEHCYGTSGQMPHRRTGSDFQ